MRYVELVEAISLSSYSGNIKDRLFDTISKITKITHREHPITADAQTTHAFLIAINANLQDAIAELSKKLCIELTSYPVDINFKKYSEARARGQYIFSDNIIWLNSSIVGSISNALMTVYRNKLQGISDVVPQGIIRAKVNELTGILIHEFTHVIQLNKIGSEEKARSYVTNDQIEVYLAKLDQSIQRNQEIYLAQPEEIGAYAQEFVVKSLVPYTKESPDKIKKFIKSLLVKLQTREKEHTYTNLFSNNTNPQYQKVYRRFLTKVYQELQRYADRLQSS